MEEEVGLLEIVRGTKGRDQTRGRDEVRWSPGGTKRGEELGAWHIAGA